VEIRSWVAYNSFIAGGRKKERRGRLGRRISSKTLALQIAKAALEKKAQEIVIVDISSKVDYADYLVICSGTSRRHVKTISGDLETSLKRKRIIPIGVEGESDGNWVLLDYGAVVVHVFNNEMRAFYDIDGLWLDADRIEVEDDRDPAPGN
jgi:ribosome-associated protein